MTYLKSTLIFIAALLLSTVSACLHQDDAGAGSGLTESQVQQMIDDAVQPLEARIAELETGLSGNVLRAPALADQTKAGLQKAATDVTAICSTLIYTPAGFPGAMQSAACRSSTGYLVQIPITTTADIVRPSMLASQRSFFAAADCTGQPYVHKDDIGEFGLAQGAVFSIYNGVMQTVYVPAGSEWSESNVPYGWEPDGAGGYTCKPIGSTGLFAVPVLPNDAQITGIADTYTGPIVY